MNVTLSQEQYLALAALAREGATQPERRRALESFLKEIDKENGIKRYALLVQWQEQDAPLPAGTDFPAVWPPEMRAVMESADRAIAKSDVLTLVKSRAKNPTNILVTRDMGGTVGWTKLDNFFVT